MCIGGFTAAFEPDDVLGASLIVNIVFTWRSLSYLQLVHG